MPLADTLLRLAAGPHLFVPKWSDRIMAEVSRTLREDFGLSPEKTACRESEIRQFPASEEEKVGIGQEPYFERPQPRSVLSSPNFATARDTHFSTPYGRLFLIAQQE
jgi:hypothetical protein